MLDPEVGRAVVIFCEKFLDFTDTKPSEGETGLLTTASFRECKEKRHSGGF